jgi:hypothetical protein
MVLGAYNVRQRCVRAGLLLLLNEAASCQGRAAAAAQWTPVVYLLMPF